MLLLSVVLVCVWGHDVGNFFGQRNPSHAERAVVDKKRSDMYASLPLCFVSFFFSFCSFVFFLPPPQVL